MSNSRGGSTLKASFHILGALMLLACSSQTPALAQFAPGQTVYFEYVGEIREGRVKSEDGYGGVIVEYRDATDGQFKGYTRTYQKNQLSTTPPAGYNPGGYGNVNGRLGGAPAAVAPAQINPAANIPQNPGGWTPVQPAQPQQPAWQPQQQPQQPQQAAAPGGGPAANGPPLTENDILAFFHARMGNDPNSVPWPGRQKVYDDLVDMIKNRGTTFKGLTVASPFDNAVRFFQPPQAVIEALESNHGAPVGPNWFYGNWNMAKHEADKHFKADDQWWAKVPGAGRADQLTINPNGTYRWGAVEGRWRAATKQDTFKLDKGASGIVLEKFRDGTDWVVYKDDRMPGENNIRAADINFPQTQFLGGRM